MRDENDDQKNLMLNRMLMQNQYNEHQLDENINNEGEEFVIKELLSSYELYLEGKKMMHCVSLYEKKCITGVSAIFSLTKENKECLTIELDLQSKRIIQARGKQNRAATNKELEILNLWTRDVVKERTKGTT